MGQLTGISAKVVYGLALGMAIFHLYSAAAGSFVALIQRSLHYTFALTLIFLLYPALKKDKGSAPSLPDALLALLATVTFSYVWLNYDAINARIPLVTPLEPLQLGLGLVAVVLVLEAARRALGMGMAIIPAVFLLYALFGHLLSGDFAHSGFSIADLSEYMYLGYDGIFGIPAGISSTYLVLFILFGCLMEKCGTGQVIMDLACAVAGKSLGGPAKIAVISSAIFGSISGSAVANVYASGVFSIPLMKKLGYKPAFAGGVEAVASTGGQLMPPVMGAAAFMMAEWLSIPYSQVCIAAILPALLYYLSLLLMVHLEAAKTGMTSMDDAEIPRLRDVAKRLYMLLPIVLLTVMLFTGYSVSRSVLFSIILAYALSFVRKDTRLTPRQVLDVLVLGSKRSCTIAIATATAGLIIGVITMTGVGLALTSNIVIYFKETLLLALFFIMLASLIMGMGVPTVVAYILVATLTAPILTRLGVTPLQAHMFVFYFAVISMITPPVAMAAWAGAEIAEANFNRTGFAAVRLSIVAFVVPFMFVYDSALLLQGEPLHIVRVALTALVGVFALSCGMQGWMLSRVPLVQRVMLAAAGLMMIDPGAATDLIGFGLLAVVVLLQVFWARKLKQGIA